ncbi:MAG: glucose-6-phosphate isomerase [Candidatus Latescibacterota bacterium]
MPVSTLLNSGPLSESVSDVIQRVESERIVERINRRDYTVWHSFPDEISNRLGWLDCPQNMPDHIESLIEIVQAAQRDGMRSALLLGMGGSSLAPEVFSQVFGAVESYLDVEVLDSTHPQAVLAKAAALNPAETLYIPATKSGGTVETLSFLKFFFKHVSDTLGPEVAGKHFIAITDPGSGLAALAHELAFRHIVLNDPNIGGRYSALSHFGLLPAALTGVDLTDLLGRTSTAIQSMRPAVELGAFMGAGANQGRDKLTLLLSPPLAPVGAWIEQLIAESTGKEGKGILPIDMEPALEATDYSCDRLFVYLRMDDTLDEHAASLVSAGQPLLQISLDELNDLGTAFYYWEFATALAGHLMGIHPFDQPDVEAAKVLARDMVQTYQEQGALPVEEPTASAGPLTAYGTDSASSPIEALKNLLQRGGSTESYVALQAYLPPNPAIDALLTELRATINQHSGLATTLGYGPRFLHSTGQLHKGDAGRGLFLQLTADIGEDLDIPDEPLTDTSSLTFGILITAQAHGDANALRAANRRLLRMHLGEDAESGLRSLIDLLSQQSSLKRK